MKAKKAKLETGDSDGMTNEGEEARLEYNENENKCHTELVEVRHELNNKECSSILRQAQDDKK